MKFLVVDGLLETRHYFIKQIESVESNAEIFESISAEDAIFSYFENEPDVIIASEILSFRNGFELARLLSKINGIIPVIIITNDASNAIEAIKNHVFEYLINPIQKEDFQITIKKSIEFIENKISRERSINQKQLKVRINTTNGYRIVDINELVYCMADGSYTNIYFTNGSMDYSSYYLGKIEKMLLDHHFVRINRACIVNLNMIKRIDRQKEICQLEFNGFLKEIKITKSNLKKLEEQNIL